MKICTKCKQEKDEQEFHKRGHKLCSWCKICRRQYEMTHKDLLNKARREWWHRTSNQRKEIYRKYKYGLSREDYNNLLIHQQNVCAICHQPEVKMRNGKVMSLMIDHDHKNNKIRGLLCHKCNIMIGHANDSTIILSNAIDYLSK